MWPQARPDVARCGLPPDVDRCRQGGGRCRRVARTLMGEVFSYHLSYSYSYFSYSYSYSYFYFYSAGSK